MFALAQQDKIVPTSVGIVGELIAGGGLFFRDPHRFPRQQGDRVLFVGRLYCKVDREFEFCLVNTTVDPNFVNDATGSREVSDFRVVCNFLGGADR